MRSLNKRWVKTGSDSQQDRAELPVTGRFQRCARGSASGGNRREGVIVDRAYVSAFRAIPAVLLCRSGYSVAEMIESFELRPDSNGQTGSFRLKRPSSRTRASD